MIPSWAKDDSNLPAFFHVNSADGSAGYATSAQTSTTGGGLVAPHPQQPLQAAAAATTSTESAALEQKKRLNHTKRLWGGQLAPQLQMDEVSMFSVTQHDIADEMSRLLLTHLPGVTKQSVITDGTACVGGNTISFAKLGFTKIQAIEFDRERCAKCFHNVEVFRRSGKYFGSGTRVEVYHGDCIKLMSELQQQIVFLDPPWGGRDYKQKGQNIPLFLSGLGLSEFCHHASLHAEYVALKLPINVHLDFLLEFDVLIHRKFADKLLFIVIKRKLRELPPDAEWIRRMLYGLAKHPHFHARLEALAS